MKLLSDLFVDIKHTINNTNNIYMDVFNIHVPPQTKIRVHVYRKNLVLLSVRPSVQLCPVHIFPMEKY